MEGLVRFLAGLAIAFTVARVMIDGRFNGIDLFVIGVALILLVTTQSIRRA